MRLASTQWWALGKESVNGWVEDRAPSMGAALAYYTAFSLSPLLLIAISVAGLFIDPDRAREAVVNVFGGLIGENGAHAVQSLVENAQDPVSGIIGTIVGVVALAIGATTVFAELQTDLDVVWKATRKTGSGVWSFIRTRFLSLGLVVAMGFLLVASLLVTALISAFGAIWGEWVGGMEPLLHGIDFAISFAIITVMFALVFKLLPSTPIAWGDVWIGAAVTSLLFSAGKIAIGLYLGKSALASSFGAAGAFVVLIVWLYYATQIFLLGAEFTRAYTHRHGSRAGAPVRANAGEPGVESAQAAASAQPERKGAAFGVAAAASRTGSHSRGRRVNRRERAVAAYAQVAGFFRAHPAAVFALFAGLGALAGTVMLHHLGKNTRTSVRDAVVRSLSGA